MRKTFVRIIAILLCAALILGLLSMLTSVLAAEVEAGDEKMLTIQNKQEFLEFAENCRLDSYSQGLTVQLQADIDLSDTDFAGIPIFCGSFVGNDHTISGLKLTNDGSYQGLFRYLTETAVVSCLKVSGTVAPDGTAGFVGGIAGSNAGRIEKSAFISGNISGVDFVGGIAGSNQVTGVISGCDAYGVIHGSHFVGGIVGENKGVIRDSFNYSAVNTTTEQNSVDISDITMDTITGSETAATVTEIGGIAGISSGSILGCTNHGDVGYPYMGYNIGGIVGRQSGYTADCINYGSINGRKEVGGISGHLEPYITVSFETDTLQILQQQVADLSEIVKRFAENTDGNLNAVATLIGQLEQYVAQLEQAVADLKSLIEEPQIESLEDIQTTLQTIEELVETIGNCLTGIEETVDSLYTALKDTVAQVDEDLQAVTDQVAVLESTLNHASDNLGGTLTDVSDGDTGESVYSTVADCLNFGQVLADLNAGGIVGIIGLENDLDPEDDVDILGESTLNYDVAVRSVVRGCSNSAAVQARKQNSGGIVGWAMLGLVRSCVNTGAVEAAAADYVGGIAGRSHGFVRDCNVKCSLAGDMYVGGIAGEAAAVSGCRSMILLESGTEKMGNIIGYTEDRQNVVDNYYMPVTLDLGGIDGISYEGCARGLSREKFLSLDGISEIFRTVTLTFLFDDGTKQCLEVQMGSSISPEDIPTIQPVDGCNGRWEGLRSEDLEQVNFDAVYTVTYTRWMTVIESEEEHSGMPQLLAQGQFHEGTCLEAIHITAEGSLDAWQFVLPEDCTVTSMRYLLPADVEVDRMVLKVRNSQSGQWRQVEHSVRGSYAVVRISQNDDAICVSAVPVDYTVYIILGAAVVLMMITLTAVLCIVKRKKGKKKNAPQSESV